MKVQASTIVRTILLVLTLINTILTAYGINPLPFSDDELYEIVSGIVTLIMIVWNWWKNNSFTQAAIAADEYMNNLKKGDN